MRTVDSVLTAEEVSEKIGITASHIRLLSSRGEVPSMFFRKAGRIWLYDKGIIGFLRSRDVRPGPKKKAR